MWAKEHYPGDVELIFEGDSIIIRPLGAEGEK
jgi:virulence-associated protein VagC